MSTLTWLDTSEKDRRRTLEFIDTFRERDTRDELGIGVVRDAFSDLMFPGCQHRADARQILPARALVLREG